MSKIPEQMQAVLLTGHGGLENLQFRDDVPVPMLDATEVLIKVAAAGVNNTESTIGVGDCCIHQDYSV